MMEAVEKNPGELMPEDSSVSLEQPKSLDGDSRTVVVEEGKTENVPISSGLVENTSENGVTVCVDEKEVLGDELGGGGLAEVEVLGVNSSVAGDDVAGNGDVLGGKEGAIEDSEINGAPSLLTMGDICEREVVAMETEKEVSGSVSGDICGEAEKVSQEESKEFGEKAKGAVTVTEVIGEKEKGEVTDAEKEVMGNDNCDGGIVAESGIVCQEKSKEVGEKVKSLVTDTEEIGEKEKGEVTDAEKEVTGSDSCGDDIVAESGKICQEESKEVGEKEKSLVTDTEEIGEKEKVVATDTEKEVTGNNSCGDDIVAESGKFCQEESKEVSEKENGESLKGSGEEMPDEKMGENGEKRESNDDDDGEDDELDDENHDYCVGDFVWGKIRSHPWWPGQIYDSSDASEFALTVKQNHRLLVAYFGDGTFAWCHPSQLKPFEENFEEMSKMSNSKNFVNAVQNTVDEIGRHVEAIMSLQETVSGHSRELAVNAGIKEGVLVPEARLHKPSSSSFEPEEILAEMEHNAKVGSVTNVLEYAILKSKLSAFYQAKGGYKLPTYYDPQPVEGLEDDVIDRLADRGDHKNGVEVQIQGPGDDRQFQKRKQKSIAAIMEEDGSADIESGKKPSESSRKEKRKGCDKNNGEDIVNLSTPRTRRRKLAELPGSSVAADDQDSSGQNHGSGTEEETTIKPPSRRGRKKNMENDDSEAKKETKAKEETSSISTAKKDHSSRGRNKKESSVENDGIKGEEEKTPDNRRSSTRKKNGGLSVEIPEANDQIERSPLSRERKKSKYLSPPYVNLYSRDLKSAVEETESSKVSNQARTVHTTTKSYDRIIGSPRVLKSCGGKEMVAKSEDENSFIDRKKVKAPANEVLSEIRSVALCPQYANINSSNNMVDEFLYLFRSSVFCNGSNYEMYKNQKPAKKRKLSGAELVSSEKEETETDQCSPELSSPRKKVKNLNGSDSNEKDSSAELFVTFGPGSSLPTKDDLIKLYNKFGQLNKKETEMFYNNFCARIVFKRSTNAEEAFNSSQKVSPFGKSSVTFRLRLPADSFKNRDPKKVAKQLKKGNGITPPTSEGGDKTTTITPTPTPTEDHDLESADSEAPELDQIKKKLEMMTTMLETTDGSLSTDMKSKLEVEMKGLLEKLSMVGSCSS